VDTIATVKQVVEETSRLVEGTKDDQLQDKTPCTEWTVRDLINHLTGGAKMFAISIEQGSIPDDVLGEIMGDNLGDDFRSSWLAAKAQVYGAFGTPGVLEKTVQLPFGTMPGQAALTIAIVDVATHAADLSKATGQEPPSDEILETALGLGKQIIGPELRQPGLFEAERPAPDGAPAADRLLAFAGRAV
jgi:uncharacterized protein (TIGR03086 family)